jgi:exonuclease III
MRIATFNVDSLDMTPNAAVALDDRIPILRPQLERLRADILCL